MKCIRGYSAADECYCNIKTGTRIVTRMPRRYVLHVYAYLHPTSWLFTATSRRRQGWRVFRTPAKTAAAAAVVLTQSLISCHILEQYRDVFDSRTRRIYTRKTTLSCCTRTRARINTYAVYVYTQYNNIAVIITLQYNIMCVL